MLDPFEHLLTLRANISAHIIIIIIIIINNFYCADERDVDHLRIYDTVGNEKQYQDSRDERYYRDCDSEQQRVHYPANTHSSGQRRNLVNSNEVLNSNPANTHSSGQRRNLVNSNEVLNSNPANTHSSGQRRNLVNSNEVLNSYPANTHSSGQRRDLINSDVILTNHPGNQHVMFGCHDNANSDDLMCDSDEVSEINYRNLPDPLIQLPKGKTSTCDKKPVEWKVGRIQQSLIDFENLSLWTDENAENKRVPDRRGNDRRTSGYLTMSNLDRDGLVAQQHKPLQYSDRDEFNPLLLVTVYAEQLMTLIWSFRVTQGQTDCAIRFAIYRLLL